MESTGEEKSANESTCLTTDGGLSYKRAVCEDSVLPAFVPCVYSPLVPGWPPSNSSKIGIS